MPSIGELKYIKRFAWLPVNIFPQFGSPTKLEDFTWLRSYYKVYRWDVKSWVVSNPETQGWTWVGNTRSIKTSIS